MKQCSKCKAIYQDKSNYCPKCGHSEIAQDTDASFLAKGTVLRENYVVLGVIGHGGFGTTYVGRDNLGNRKIAIKEYLPAEFATRVPGRPEVSISSDPKRQKQFHDGLVRFIEEGKRIGHLQREEGAVRIFDTFEANYTAYIVMEFLDGGLLSGRIGDEDGAHVRLAPGEAVGLALSIIKSLKPLHEAGIFHLNITPENVFITKEGKAKLIDFGAYRHVTTSHSRSLSVVVKSGYSAEELYRSSGDLGAHTDVYALGALLYRMITGETPPDAMERRRCLANGKKDPLKPIRKINGAVPKGLENAILNALNVQIKDRTPNVTVLEEGLTTASARRLGQKVKFLDIGKWPGWAKAAVGAGAAAIAAIITLVATGVIGFEPPEIVPEGMARVPAVINSPLDQAGRRIEAAGLQYMIVGKEFSGVIPADYVLSQDITAGSIVEANTMIAIVVSGGAEMGLVPFVEGLLAEDAQAELEGAGFEVRLIFEYSRFIVEGSVVSQSEEGGQEFPLGGTISLRVSRGPDPDSPEPYLTEVPDVVGLTYSEAVKAANDAGFAVQVLERRYGTEPENTVVSQSLAADTREMTDKPMGLVVSLGVRMARVPDVQFRTQAEAEKLLRDEGFTVTVTTEFNDTVVKGSVVGQSPSGGSIKEFGSSVAISVSSGGQPFKMPRVDGETESAARSALSEQGLRVSVSYENSDTVADGRVIRQSPAPNAEVVRGDEVTIVVSSGRVIAVVPNVVGKTRADAERALRDLKLVPDSSTGEYNETVPEGSVIAQVPQAGARHPEGTTVVLVISRGREPITLPKLTGVTLAQAKASLIALGIRESDVVTREENSDDVAQGAVISQEPASGRTVYRGDTVTLVVSIGPESVPVPSVIGETRASAESTMKGSRYKFAVEIIQEYSDAYAVGRVAQQYPAPQTMLPKGSTVTLSISLGPLPPVITSGSSTSVMRGTGGTFQVTATSAAPVAFTLTGAPSGVTINSSSGVITIAATAAEGAHVFTITASNGAPHSATQSFTLTVISDFVPVSNISGVPTSATAGATLALSSNVAPPNATNQMITWSVSGGDVPGASVSGSVLTAPAAGTVTVRATIRNGVAEGTDYVQDFTISVMSSHVPVANIAGIPTSMTAGTPIALSGAVAPSNATNQFISWSVQSPGATNASVSGSILSATAEGTVVVRATIANGASDNTNYVQDFSIEVAPAHIPVASISGVPTEAVAGSPVTLMVSVSPANATHQIISWSVLNPDPTGAFFNGNVLSTSAAGTVTIRATIVNGASATTNYTQDFVIAVSEAQTSPPDETGPPPPSP